MEYKYELGLDIHCSLRQVGVDLVQQKVYPNVSRMTMYFSFSFCFGVYI